MRRVEVLRLPHTDKPEAENPEPLGFAGKHRRVGPDETAESEPNAPRPPRLSPRTVVGGWIPGQNETGDPVDEDDEDEDEDEDPVIRPRRVGRTWGRFAELWVPENMRDARVDPGRRGALILLLVAAVAAVATAVGVWRDRPEPRPVETTALAQVGVSTIDVSSGAVTIASAEPAPAEPANPTEIVVSVTGLVVTPGVVKLPNGSRVADAIAAAGGVSEGADLTGLNLAAKLSDGESVVVGDAASASAASASGVSGASGGAGALGDATGGSLINLNTADEAALDTLPGVGPVMAQNILAWRDTNGKFSSVEQLQEISGIGPSRYAQISPLVTVS